MTLFRLHLKFGLRLPAYLRDISVRTAYVHAKKRYRPATPFGGELLLLRATSGVGNDEAYVDRYVDPLLGWSPRTTQGLRVVDVPGGHSSMLQEPNAPVLAGHLQPYMSDAIKRAVPAAAEAAVRPARPARTRTAARRRMPALRGPFTCSWSRRAAARPWRATRTGWRPTSRSARRRICPT